MNCLVVGTGGVGLIAAYTLQRNGKCQVTAVVRSEFEDVKENGYNIDSVDYGKISGWMPDRIVKSVDEASDTFFDFIFLSTKNIPDGEATCEDIVAPAVKPGTCIVLAQNGIDNEKPMMENFPESIILSGVSLIGSTRYGCNVIQNGPDNLSLGYFSHPEIDEQTLLEKAETFIDLYKNDVNTVKYDPQVRLTRWKKLVYNAAINTTTALVNLDCSRVSLCGGKELVQRPAMREIYAIAKSEGFDIPEEVQDIMLNISDGTFYTPSMLVDYRNGRMMELEVILGNPLKIAKQNRVECPVLSMLYALLSMVQFRLKEERGLVHVDDAITRPDASTYGKGFN